MKTKPAIPEPPFVDRLTPIARKRIIKLFEGTGKSSHSAQGLTLAALLRHCLDTKQNFRLHAAPGQGYYLEKSTLPEVERQKWHYRSESYGGNLHAAARYINDIHPDWDVVAMDCGGDHNTLIVYRLLRS